MDLFFLTCSWCHRPQNRRSWWSPARCSSWCWSSHILPGGAPIDSGHSYEDLRCRRRNFYVYSCPYLPCFSFKDHKHPSLINMFWFCKHLYIVIVLAGSDYLFLYSAPWPVFFLPCCSMLSLCRGLSLLKETTDSVSVWSSRVSTLPVALGLSQKVNIQRAIFCCCLKKESKPMQWVTHYTQLVDSIKTKAAGCTTWSKFIFPSNTEMSWCSSRCVYRTTSEVKTPTCSS